MPNRDGFTTEHGFMRRDGKPDTRNVACMKDCVHDGAASPRECPTPRATSTATSPSRAVPSGPRARTPQPGPPPKAGLELAKAAACTACHGVTEKRVGPGFREVAARYAGDAGAEARLVAKIRPAARAPGARMPMPAQPQVKEADARALVQWILGGAKVGAVPCAVARAARRLAVIFKVTERRRHDEHATQGSAEDRRRRHAADAGRRGRLAEAGRRLAADAWNKAAFETKTMDETIKALGGAAPAQSKDITFFQTPDIAENGAVVPVGVTSNIPKTESIAILIEKNPNMLAAVFDIPAGTDPSVSTRVKMGQSSNIYALVKADGKYYVASKEVKVTLGGCGG